MKFDSLSIFALILIVIVTLSFIVIGKGAMQCKDNPFTYISHKVADKTNSHDVNCVCIPDNHHSTSVAWNGSGFISQRVGYLS